MTSASVLNYNINGLLSKVGDPDFVDYVHNYDFIIFTETHLLFQFDHNVKFDKYVCYQQCGERVSRIGRAAGGVMLLINKMYENYIIHVDTSHCNIIACTLNKDLWGTDCPVMLIALYNNPLDSPFYNNKEFDSILEVLENMLTDHVERGQPYLYVITGDFNARISNWGLEVPDEEEGLTQSSSGSVEYARKSDDNQINQFGRKLIEICVMFGITPIHGLVDCDFTGGFTFIGDRGSSVVDYHICSTELLLLVKDFKIDVRVEADHMPSIAEFYLNMGKKDQKNEKKFMNKIVWDPEKAQSYKDFFQEENTVNRLNKLMSDLNGGQDINENVIEFQSLLREAGKDMTKSICTGGKVKRGARWFDKECREAKKRARRALHRFQFNRKRVAADKLLTFKNEYKNSRNEYMSIIKKKKLEFKQKTYQELLDSKGDSSKFWGLIKGLRRLKTSENSITIEEWEEHFRLVLQPSDMEPDNEQIMSPSGENHVNDVDELDTVITEEEVLSAIKKLKAGRAAGLRH